MDLDQKKGYHSWWRAVGNIRTKFWQGANDARGDERAVRIMDLWLWKCDIGRKWEYYKLLLSSMN